MRKDQIRPAAVNVERLAQVSHAIAEHSMCQPGLPAPHCDGQDGSPGLARFHSTKSSGSRLLRSTRHAFSGTQVVDDFPKAFPSPETYALQS